MLFYEMETSELPPYETLLDEDLAGFGHAIETIAPSSQVGVSYLDFTLLYLEK